VSLTDGRAIGSPLAAVLLIAVTVALAGVLAVNVGGWSPEAGPDAAIEMSVDGDTGAVVLEHVAGDPIDVEELSVVVSVDGEELTHQPPVPFAGAEGFYGTPDGPFNVETDDEWTVGERTTFRVAGTNEPTIEPGSDVVVALTVDGRTVARLEATAT